MSRKTILTVNTPVPRLDRFLHQQYPALSTRRWKQALTDGRIFVDERRAKKGSSLRPGQTISFAPELIEELTIKLRPAALPELEILYQDDRLLALNKPAECHTHPLSDAETETLANHLLAKFPELAGVGEFGPLQPGLLNRLDYLTSGIVLAARCNPTWQKLRQQFIQHRIRKEYLAEVSGILESKLVIENDLTHDLKDRRRMLATPPAQPCRGTYPAKTEIFPLNISSAKNRSRVRLIMYSGVMHQLRVHLAACGHPIIGDPLYGGSEALQNHQPENHQPESNDLAAADHLRLHCAKMTLADGLVIEAPLPEWACTK